jgi:hypothetical protein
MVMCTGGNGNSFAAPVECRWITTESRTWRFYISSGVADRVELGGFLYSVALSLDASSNRPKTVLGGFIFEDVVS